MAKISDLPDVEAPDGTEEVLVVKNGVARKTRVASLPDANLASLRQPDGAGRVGVRRARSAVAPIYIEDRIAAGPQGLWSYFDCAKDGGTIADSTVDDIVQFITDGGQIAAEYDGTWQPGKSLTWSGGCRIDWQGSRILHRIDGQLISVTAAYLDNRPILAIDNTATTDLSGGSTATPSDVCVLDMGQGGTEGYRVNDPVKIFDDSLSVGVRISDTNRRAEYGYVARVDGRYITLFSRLRDSYPLNPRIARLDMSKRFEMLNGVLDNGGIFHDRGAVIATGFWRPKIWHMGSTGSQDQFLRIVGCMDLDLGALWGKALHTNPDPALAAGYLTAIVACQGGVINGMWGHNLRHGFTTSPGRVADADLGNRARDYTRGKSRDILVTNMQGIACQGPFIDTHDDSENIRFATGHFAYAYNGPRNYDYGAQLRGRANRITGVTCEGGSGIAFITDADDGAIMGGHKVDVFVWRSAQTTKECYGIRLKGTATNPVVGVRVRGAELYSTLGNYAPVRVGNGALALVAPCIEWAATTSAVGLVRLEAGGNIEIDGGRLDFTGTASGTAARVVKWDASAGDNSCTARITGVRIVTPSISAVAAIFDLSGFVGTAEALDIRSNLRTGYAEGVTGLPTAVIATTANSRAITIVSGTLVPGQLIRGAAIVDGATVASVNGSSAMLSANASATVAELPVTQGRAVVDLRTTGSAASNPAVYAYDRTAAGGAAAGWTLALDMLGRAQAAVWLVITTDLAGGIISSALPGAFVGQRLRVENASASTASFLVWRVPGSKLGLTYNVRLSPGDGIWLRWDGAAWVSDQSLPGRYGSKVFDPPLLANNAQQSTTIAVSGVVVGDQAVPTHTAPLKGTRLWAEVTAADTVTVYHRNDTGAAVDVDSGTLAVTVTPQR